jgi:glycosyltransferase involved in cell wall biosynthesis
MIKKEKIIIYRRQLFKTSEIFIESQVKFYKKFAPLFVGRKIFSIPKSSIEYIIPKNQNIFDIVKDVIFVNQNDYVKRLKQYNPKVIHAHFGVDAIYAMKIAKQLKIPLVTTLHGFDVTTTNISFLLSKKPAFINYLLFRKKLAKNGDLFIAVSNFIRDRAIGLGFPKDRIVTHYMGIDTEVKVSNSQKSGDRILHVARLVEKKGTLYLIKAFQKVVEKNRGVKLIIIGDGYLKDSLKKLSEKLGIKNSVEFLGAIENQEVLIQMEKSDIFTLPSITAKNGDSEGLGMVFLEAGIRGLPIVATDHGGIPEVVKDGFNGYLVQERDIDMLADKLNFLLKNRDIREKFGQNSISFIRENFDIEKQSAKLEEIYRELIK